MCETSSEGDASIIESCMIEDGEAYGKEEIATDKGVEVELAIHKIMAYAGAETLVVVLESEHKTKEIEGCNGKTKPTKMTTRRRRWLWTSLRRVVLLKLSQNRFYRLR